MTIAETVDETTSQRIACQNLTFPSDRSISPVAVFGWSKVLDQALYHGHDRIFAKVVFFAPRCFIMLYSQPNGLAQRTAARVNGMLCQHIVLLASQVLTISGRAAVRWSRCWADMFIVNLLGVYPRFLIC